MVKFGFGLDTSLTLLRILEQKILICLKLFIYHKCSHIQCDNDNKGVIADFFLVFWKRRAVYLSATIMHL